MFSNTKNQSKRNHIRYFSGDFGIWEYHINEGELVWSDEVFSILEIEDKNQLPSFAWFLSFVHEEDRETLKNVYYESIMGFKLYGPLKHKVITEKGNLKHVEEIGFTEYDDDGQPTKTIGLIRDISAEVAIESELQRQHEYVNSLIGSLPQLIFVTDRDGVFLDTISANQDMYYIDPIVFLGKHYSEVLPKNLCDLFNDTYKKLRAGSKQEHIEYELFQNSTTKYFEGVLKPFSDNKFIAIIKDITELKTSLVKYKNIASLQSLLVKISSSFIAIDDQNVDLQINWSLRKLGAHIGADRFYIFSYDFENMTASNTYEWCAEGIEPQIDYLQNVPVIEISEWLDNHKAGKIMAYQNIFDLPEDHGVRKILEPQGIKSIITMPLMEGSECVGFIGLDYVTDFYSFSDEEKQLLILYSQMIVSLYERIKTNKILSQNQKFLYDIINNSGSIIAQKDKEGKYTLVNKKWLSITGLSPNKVLGKNDLEIFPNKTALQFMQNDHEVLTKGRNIEKEEFLESDKGTRYFISTKFPTHNENNEISGLCAMITEITDRRRAEEAEILRRKSEAANQAKSEFLSRVSHEIRTPLNAILGFSQLLRQSDGLSRSQKQYIDAVWKSGDHLLSLINDILDFSKIEAGKVELNYSTFSLTEMLKNLKLMFLQMAGAKKLNLSFSCDCTNIEYIYSDSAKIRQILINLINNSIKFTEKGFVSLNVFLVNHQSNKPTSSEKKWLKFIVEDSGIGIPKEETETIFERFVQLKDGQKSGGTGLGLPIVKKIVELLGGSIELETKQHFGTKFIVQIPVIAQKAEAFTTFLDNNTGVTNETYNQSHYYPEIFDLKNDTSILSAKSLLNMEEAVHNGDITKLSDIISSIETISEALENEINTLVANYDYTSLLLLFNKLKLKLKESK